LRLQDMRNVYQNCILASALCFWSSAYQGKKRQVNLSPTLRNSKASRLAAAEPQGLRSGKTVRQVPKTTPYFYQKARSAFLFYKFYKFRA